MNCRTCRSKLALHAGGDLPKGEAQEVEAHLTSCPDCRTELVSYRRSREVIRELANQDTFVVPDNLADEIMYRITDTQRNVAATRRPIWYPIIFRYGLAACLLMSIGLIWFRISGDMARYRLRLVESQTKVVQALVSRDRSLVSAGKLATLSVSGPWRLDEWEPSGSAGIYAILHKPDPENQPDLFTVDYLGEAGRIEYYGDPWRRQRINRLTERAGSEDNIYIAEYPMSGRTVKERRAVLNILVDTFQPHYN